MGITISGFPILSSTGKGRREVRWNESKGDANSQRGHLRNRMRPSQRRYLHSSTSWTRRCRILVVRRKISNISKRSPTSTSRQTFPAIHFSANRNPSPTETSRLRRSTLQTRPAGSSTWTTTAAATAAIFLRRCQERRHESHHSLSEKCRSMTMFSSITTRP